MKAIEEHTIQRCRACNTVFELEKDDCTSDSERFWLYFRCQKCDRLNELHGIPDSFRGLLNDA